MHTERKIIPDRNAQNLCRINQRKGLGCIQESSDDDMIVFYRRYQHTTVSDY